MIVRPCISDNKPENAITYTKLQATKSAEMLEMAQKLAHLIDMPTNKVTYRDKQDFWILRNNDAAKAKVTEEEMTKFRNQMRKSKKKK